MRLREVGQYFGFFSWDARDLLRKFLDLTDQIFLPHEVLVGVGRRQVRPLLTRERFFVVCER